MICLKEYYVDIFVLISAEDTFPLPLKLNKGLVFDFIT